VPASSAAVGAVLRAAPAAGAGCRLQLAVAQLKASDQNHQMPMEAHTTSITDALNDHSKVGRLLD